MALIPLDLLSEVVKKVPRVTHGHILARHGGLFPRHAVSVDLTEQVGRLGRSHNRNALSGWLPTVRRVGESSRATNVELCVVVRQVVCPLSVSLDLLVVAGRVHNRGNAGTLAKNEVVGHWQESDPLLLGAEVVGLGDA